MQEKLTLGLGNAKLSKTIATFSIPAGHTCPFAKECMSKANEITGKVIDGKHCKYRCFAASEERLFPNVRKARWRNYRLLTSCKSIAEMGDLIQKSLPKDISIVRIHASGDFYSERYFLAWLNVAYNNPKIKFYGYTKGTPFMVKYKKVIPLNFHLTASKGGTCDSLIPKNKLKFAEVVFSVKEASDKNLELDHDDGLAIYGTKSFALLLHGNQPAQTPAAKALQVLKSQGITGYGKNNIFRKPAMVEKAFEVFINLNETTKKKVEYVS